jgi:hypothetical protein
MKSMFYERQQQASSGLDYQILLLVKLPSALFVLE